MDLSSSFVHSAIALGTGIIIGYKLSKSASSLKRIKRRIKTKKSSNDALIKLKAIKPNTT